MNKKEGPFNPLKGLDIPTSFLGMRAKTWLLDLQLRAVWYPASVRPYTAHNRLS